MSKSVLYTLSSVKKCLIDSLSVLSEVMSNILSPAEKMLLRQPEHKDALLDRIVTSLDLVESKGETGAWQWSQAPQPTPFRYN